MKIDVTFDSSAASAPADFEAIVEDVAQFYDSEFSNPITITIDVGWGEVDGQKLSAGSLGESMSTFASAFYTYPQVRSALIANAQTSDAKAAVATLASADPTGGGTFSMTTAEAKALGLAAGNSPGIDGYVGFSSAPNTFDFSVTSNDQGYFLPTSAFDFFGVVAHEFSEVLGRQLHFGVSSGGKPGDGTGYYPFDLFDYSASGQRSFEPSATLRYFSINAGATRLGNFNTDSSGDLFDWGPGFGIGAFDAFATPGVESPVSVNDLTLLNVLGYALTPAFAASGAVLQNEFLAVTIADTSHAAATASKAGVYLGAPYKTPTTADTLLATFATPALAAGASVSATLALPLSRASPGFYSLALIPDADGAVAQSNAMLGTSNILEIGVLDSANVGSVPQGDGRLLCFDLGGLEVTKSLEVFGLYVGAALDGAGALQTSGETLTFGPGASLGIAGIDVYSRFAVIDTDLTYAGEWSGSINTEIIIAAGHTLDLAGVADIIDGVVSGAGTLALSGAGHLALGDGAVLAVPRVDQSGASVFRWTVPNLFFDGVWDQSAGTIAIAKGGRITFEGAGDIFAGTITGAGVVAFTRGSVTFDGATLSAKTIVVNGLPATLEGTISLSGALTANTPNLVVGAAGATLTGGGTLEFTDRATNRLFGAVDTAVLTNFDDRIVGSGRLGNGEIVLVNEARGVIDGDESAGLVIATGLRTITNAGVIEATDRATVTIASPIDNAGRIFAAGGDVTVEGAVTGAGSGWINGGTLDFTAAFSQNVLFGASGVLELAHSQAFGGRITGFSTSGATALDLRDIAFGGATRASYSGTKSAGVLTVTDGAHTCHIALVGDYLASVFTVASDGHGGTKVVDPAAARFAQTAAAFAPGRAAMAPATAGPERETRLALAAPRPTA